MQFSKFKYSCASIVVTAILWAPAINAEIIRVSPHSPLKQMVEDYLPGDYAPGEDPLQKPGLEKNSNEVVELGWKYFKKNDYDTALKRFMMAIRLNRTDAHGYFGVAYVCSVQNYIDDAIIFYREALKYDKNYAPIYANLAKCLGMKNRKSIEVPQLLDRAISVDPKCAEAYVTYASYYAQKNDWPAAATKANLAIRAGRILDPEIVNEFKSHGIELQTSR
jgi:tetratricopeptide (TPR) repeat protein